MEPMGHIAGIAATTNSVSGAVALASGTPFEPCCRFMICALLALAATSWAERRAAMASHCELRQRTARTA
jgi:hypothetical protein